MKRGGHRMSEMQVRPLGDELRLKDIYTRRNFLYSSSLVAAALAASKEVFAVSSERVPADEGSAIHLGLASYTFRNFSRAQTIGFLKQLNLLALNAKDVKDHLPMDPQQEAAALADYSAATIKLHAAGTIYFAKDEDADIRNKFEYCKRAGIGVIVAGGPAPGAPPGGGKILEGGGNRFFASKTRA